MSRSHVLPVLELAVATLAGRAADGPASHIFQVNGVTIHYLVQGEGEPVLLIHGLGSSARHPGGPAPAGSPLFTALRPWRVRPPRP
jgi:hypothetical protein